MTFKARLITLLILILLMAVLLFAMGISLLNVGIILFCFIAFLLLLFRIRIYFIPSFRGLSLLEVIRLQLQFTKPLLIIETLIPAPHYQLSAPNPIAFHQDLLANGFLPHPPLSTIATKYNFILYTHPSLHCAALLIDQPNQSAFPILHLSCWLPDGSYQSIISVDKQTTLLPSLSPTLQRTILRNASFSQLLHQMETIPLSQRRAPAPDEVIHMYELIAYTIFRDWQRIGFQYEGPFASVFAEHTQKLRDNAVKIFQRAWDNLHLGFLCRYHHQQGLPVRELSPKEITQYIAAHADQTADAFFGQLLSRLDQHPSPATFRFAAEISGIRRSFPPNSSGLDAAQYLLTLFCAQSSDQSPLQTIARFDHPVQAFLLRIT